MEYLHNKLWVPTIISNYRHSYRLDMITDLIRAFEGSFKVYVKGFGACKVSITCSADLKSLEAARSNRPLKTSILITSKIGGVYLDNYTNVNAKVDMWLSVIRDKYFLYNEEDFLWFRDNIELFLLTAEGHIEDSLAEMLKCKEQAPLGVGVYPINRIIRDIKYKCVKKINLDTYEYTRGSLLAQDVKQFRKLEITIGDFQSRLSIEMVPTNAFVFNMSVKHRWGSDNWEMIRYKGGYACSQPLYLLDYIFKSGQEDDFYQLLHIFYNTIESEAKKFGFHKKNKNIIHCKKSGMICFDIEKKDRKC